jgi:outer membrane protein assembly factor BamE
MRRTLTILAATAAVVAISGCVYRPTIQQGNLLQLDEIEQVHVGMTRSQVRYILGTPMVSDPFEPDRWDYVYTLQRGRDTHIDRTHFVVLFEGDKVSRVERRDQPEESEVAQRVKAERSKKAAEDAKAKAAAPAPASSPATQSPGTTPPPGG